MSEHCAGRGQHKALFCQSSLCVDCWIIER